MHKKTMFFYVNVGCYQYSGSLNANVKDHLLSLMKEDYSMGTDNPVYHWDREMGQNDTELGGGIIRRRRIQPTAVHLLPRLCKSVDPRELHINTERPNTKLKPTPSVLKNWETEVRFSSGGGFGLGFQWNRTFSLL